MGLYFVSDNKKTGLTQACVLLPFQAPTPVLSHDQDLKKDTNKRSLYSEPLRPTDTGKYCQNLKTWGKNDFLPRKWVKKT